MALAAKRDARMDVSEFRLWAAGRPDHERRALPDGAPPRMAPPRERHPATVAHLIDRISDRADGRGCRAMPGRAILSAATDASAPIPDSAGRRGPPPPGGPAEDPLPVAAIRSPATMRLDRGRRIGVYRTVPGRVAFLIAASDSGRRRGTGGDGSVAALRPDGTGSPPGRGGAVPARDIDRGLAF